MNLGMALESLTAANLACASPKRGAERVHGGRAQADPCSLRFERRGRKRPVLNDVLVDGFECLAQWGEQLLRQAAEEHVSNQVDVARGRVDDRSPTPGGQPDLRRPPIRGSQVALDESAALHSLGVVRQAAPLPTDLGREGADLHALFTNSAQGVEDVVVGKR